MSRELANIRASPLVVQCHYKVGKRKFEDVTVSTFWPVVDGNNDFQGPHQNSISANPVSFSDINF